MFHLSSDSTLATLLLLLRPLSHKTNRLTSVTSFTRKQPHKGNKTLDWTAALSFSQSDGNLTETLRDLLSHSFNGDTEDGKFLSCRAGRFKRVGTVLQGESHLHLAKL